MPSSENILNREALLESERAEIPSLPLLAIRGHLCFRCWQPSTNLSKCSGCKRAVFCSRRCQKLDWDNQHKRHCKLLRKINGIEEKEWATSRSWKQYSQSLYGKIQVLGDHSEEQILRNIVQGQSYCTTCHRSAIHVSLTQATLNRCSKCHLVSTCSTCTSLHSAEECKRYQKLGQIEQYRIEYFGRSGQATCRAPTDAPRTVHKTLSSAANWSIYYTDISDKGGLRGLVKSDFTLNEQVYEGLPAQEAQMTERMWLYLFLATEAMTIPLTILAGLEDVLPELPDAQSLSIHIVGAAGKEFANLMLFEELLHLLPSLIYLRVVTIGPRSPGESAGQTGGLSQEVSMACCSICESQGRRRTVTSYRGLYHDYARTSQYQKPDLAVLFHSGRSQAEGASWAPTTRFLVDSATATLCTTYTNREALEEVAELDHLGARMIVRPEVNRWKALPPLPDFLEREHTVYYHNFYRYIFQGKM